MQKRGAIFFTIDTMIAGVVLALTVIVLLSLYVTRPITEDTKDVLDNYVDYVAFTKMYQFRNNYKFIYDDANESQPGLAVYHKIDSLVVGGERDRATSFISNFTQIVLPSQFGMEYKIDGLVIFSRSAATPKLKTNLTTRLMTYFRNDTDSIIGPNVTQITIWS